MTLPIQASLITGLHKEQIIKWKKTDVFFEQEGFYRLVEENHAFNYQLWHAEDKARRDDKGYEFVYHAKRAIDRYNQERNNRMEAMDGWLFTSLKPAAIDCCPVHSETPGMMIDRLSILALKAYHMAEQTQRHDVDEQHQQRCMQKLHIIQQQLKQLADCLDVFIHEISLQQRTFKIYNQFKMYNDPTLNPQLYTSAEA